MSELTPEERKWVEDAFDRSRPGISESSLFVVGFSGKRDDATQCLQLGMAIMMNKPIIIMADGDVKIPKTLERVAVKVMRSRFDDPKAMQEAAEQLRKIVEDDEEA